LNYIGININQTNRICYILLLKIIRNEYIFIYDTRRSIEKLIKWYIFKRINFHVYLKVIPLGGFSKILLIEYIWINN
jgi:hypothetical protein